VTPRPSSSHPSWLWAPAALWAALIFAASSVSRVPDLPAHVTDKMVHASVYAVLAGACLRAMAGGRWTGVTMGAAAAAVLMATAYGVTDELHQRFVPGRTADVLDLLADFTGSMASAVLALGTSWLRPRWLATMKRFADGHAPGR
jgi:VanZ family protein